MLQQTCVYITGVWAIHPPTFLISQSTLVCVTGVSAICIQTFCTPSLTQAYVAEVSVIQTKTVGMLQTILLCNAGVSWTHPATGGLPRTTEGLKSKTNVIHW